MLKKVYYYTFSEIYDNPPFAKMDCESMIKSWFNEETLSGRIVPSDINSNNAIYTELLSLVVSRFRHNAIIKIVKKFNEEDPSSEEVNQEFNKWGFKFLALLNDTHDYYVTLLTNYASAKADLMADITATSKNKVKFNDTPQNPNTASVYEGDDYITHFTATEGETKSPLMSKIMRLKEIQDAYKDAMSDWVRVFERIFYEEEVESTYE